jgi:hypothetical protein
MRDRDRTRIKEGKTTSVTETTFLIVFLLKAYKCEFEELDGPAVCALWRAIAEIKQRWSVIGWVTKKLSRASPCSARPFKPLVPAAFAIVSTHQPALGPRGGLWPVLLMCLIHEEGLCPSCGDINRQMMMMKCESGFFTLPHNLYNNLYVTYYGFILTSLLTFSNYISRYIKTS